MKLLAVVSSFLFMFNHSGFGNDIHNNPAPNASGRTVETGRQAFALAKLGIVRDTCGDFHRGTVWGVVAHYNCVNLREAVKNVSSLGGADCSGNAGTIGGPQQHVREYGVSCGIFSDVLRDLGCGRFTGLDRQKCDAVDAAINRRQCTSGMTARFQEPLCRGILLGIEQAYPQGCRSLDSTPRATCEQLVRMRFGTYLRTRE